MTTFTQKIQAQLSEFSPFLNLVVEIPDVYFQQKRATVAAFITEINFTCQQIEQQQQSEYVAVFAQKLVNQYACLKQAIERHSQTAPKKFVTRYRFSADIHHLPVPQRLIEYKKVLRALNEKLSWLIEQSYLCSDSEKAYYVNQINDTEQRKQRCLQAIEQLE